MKRKSQAFWGTEDSTTMHSAGYSPVPTPFYNSNSTKCCKLTPIFVLCSRRSKNQIHVLFKMQIL